MPFYRPRYHHFSPRYIHFKSIISKITKKLFDPLIFFQYLMCFIVPIFNVNTMEIGHLPADSTLIIVIMTSLCSNFRNVNYKFIPIVWCKFTHDDLSENGSLIILAGISTDLISRAFTDSIRILLTKCVSIQQIF